MKPKVYIFKWHDRAYAFCSEKCARLFDLIPSMLEWTPDLQYAERKIGCTWCANQLADDIEEFADRMSAGDFTEVTINDPED